MRCDKFRGRFPEYIDDALGSGDRRALEAHLRSCETCRDELESFRELDALLKQEAPKYWESIQPAPDFLARLQRLDMEPSTTQAPGIVEWLSSLWLRHRLVLAAGLSVCIVVALVITVPRMTSPGEIARDESVEKEVVKEVVKEVPVEKVVEREVVKEIESIPAPASPPAPSPDPTSAFKQEAGGVALGDYEQQILKAVGYLKSHFNPEVGLIYESEEPNSRIIDRHPYRYDQTYWLYSDNLIASYAIEPFDEDVADEIRGIMLRYNQPPSRLFEVLFGEPIPENISIANQVVVTKEPEFLIMAELHDSPTSLSWQDYGDTLIYQSLNQHLRHNREASEKYFQQAYSMWDGKGIYDAATMEKNAYANYKLALILYASKVVDISIPDYSQIEARLWSMTNPNGGLAAHASLDGNRLGSANCETTSMALLPYHEELIIGMR